MHACHLNERLDAQAAADGANNRAGMLRLARVGGELYITGLDDRLFAVLSDARRLQDGNDPVLFRSTPSVGASTRAQLERPKSWLYPTFPDKADETDRS